MSKQVTLPSNNEVVELPELSTEQVLQLIRITKSVLTKIPDLLTVVEEARLDYLQGEAKGFVTKAYFEDLKPEQRQEVEDKLTAEFQEWFIYEDLNSEEHEALASINITPESLEKEPVQFSIPSEVPMLAMASRVVPEIYDACANEIILSVCIVLISPGRLEKAVRSNTVDGQLLDYRADLTKKMKPADFITLAAAVVAYVLQELKELGGPLGKVLTDIQGQLGELAGQNPPQTQSLNENESEQNSEKSEPELSSSSQETPTDSASPGEKYFT